MALQTVEEGYAGAPAGLVQERGGDTAVDGFLFFFFVVFSCQRDGWVILFHIPFSSFLFFCYLPSLYHPPFLSPLDGGCLRALRCYELTTLTIFFFFFFG